MVQWHIVEYSHPAQPGKLLYSAVSGTGGTEGLQEMIDAGLLMGRIVAGPFDDMEEAAAKKEELEKQ